MNWLLYIRQKSIYFSSPPLHFSPSNQDLLSGQAVVASYNYHWLLCLYDRLFTAVKALMSFHVSATNKPAGVKMLSVFPKKFQGKSSIFILWVDQIRAGAFFIRLHHLEGELKKLYIKPRKSIDRRKKYLQSFIQPIHFVGLTLESASDHYFSEPVTNQPVSKLFRVDFLSGNMNSMRRWVRRPTPMGDTILHAASTNYIT